jgi:hypothetical protein
MKSHSKAVNDNDSALSFIVQVSAIEPDSVAQSALPVDEG